METTVEQVLKQKFGKVKKAANGYVRIACPTCDPHNAMKFKRYVHTTTLYTKCWICETPITFQQLTGSDIKPSVAKHVVEAKVIDPRALVLPCKSGTPINELPENHPAIQFLKKDHLHDIEKYAKHYGVIYCPASEGIIFRDRNPLITSAERLIFPVYFQEKLVGWQMRSIPGTFYGDREDVVRYYHLFSKGDYLFNYDNARQYEMVIVVEGIKKALKFPNGVATLGKGISDTQIQILQQWPKITIMLDGEDNTQEKAREIATGLNTGPCSVVNIDLREYGYESPDEATAEELHKIVYNVWNQV